MLLPLSLSAVGPLFIHTRNTRLHGLTTNNFLYLPIGPKTERNAELVQ